MAWNSVVNHPLATGCEILVASAKFSFALATRKEQFRTLNKLHWHKGYQRLLCNSFFHQKIHVLVMCSWMREDIISNLQSFLWLSASQLLSIITCRKFIDLYVLYMYKVIFTPNLVKWCSLSEVNKGPRSVE